jgi:hypothetical protein
MADRHAERAEPERERAWWTWWESHGQAHLTRLLREEWNPIGYSDVPASEYDAYATRLGGILREGASEDEIADYLADVRTGAMGLPAHPDDDRRVAASVHAWYAHAHRV